MSKQQRDIRTFFTTVRPSTSKAKAILISDDEDVIESTPPPKKKQSRRSKTRSPTKSPKVAHAKKKEKLKPVNVNDLFSGNPVKQVAPKTPKAEKGKSDKTTAKGKDAFNKTLQQLDEEDDFLQHVDMVDLDRTIDLTLQSDAASKQKAKSPSSESASRKRKADVEKPSSIDETAPILERLPPPKKTKIDEESPKSVPIVERLPPPKKTKIDKESPKKVRNSPRKLTNSQSLSEGTIKKATTKPIKKVVSETSVFKREPVPVLEENQSWTEKYKPTNIKGIIGQQDAKSNMNKLLNWLRNWHKYHGVGKNKLPTKRPSPWARDDDGAFFKAALLSGPPGVGKTTVATLVAKELGCDVVEMNASDTRSKKLLKEEVAQLLNTTSLSNYVKVGGAPTCKRVLLMDEVDGMSGNNDRGGLEELISLIKGASVPIICMCNDRQHQKMRTLANHCYDLKFGPIKVEAVRGAMMSICFKEGVSIQPKVLSDIISSTGGDVRQTLNNLCMWSVGKRPLTADTTDKEREAAKKDTVIEPWEVVRKVFSTTEHSNVKLSDRIKLFFYDYSIGPLFVQENYLQVRPNAKDKLKAAAMTAHAISMSDLIDTQIRRNNNWSRLEQMGFFSSVMPGHYMEGQFTGKINFPSWLGKNSKRGKFSRLTTELQMHMRTKVSANKEAVNLDYIYALRDRIANPLIKHGTAGVGEAMEIMKDYNLLREDVDAIMELSLWPGGKDTMAQIDSKVKAAFTRTYNKDAPALPFSTHAVSKKKGIRGGGSQEEDFYPDEEEEGQDSDNANDDDIANDPMIKEKKKATATKAVAERSKASTPKAKGSRGGRAKRPK